MIDRGALVLAPHARGAYRGVDRPSLDAQAFTGKKGRALAKRYAGALVEGDGVVEDLDEALAMRAEATKMGIAGLDVIVFEVPQDRMPARTSLALAATPPADGLAFLGYDVFEPIEPYASILAGEDPPPGLNAAGLFDQRADAEACAIAANTRGGHDEPLVAARIWAAPSG